MRIRESLRSSENPGSMSSRRIGLSEVEEDQSSNEPGKETFKMYRYQIWFIFIKYFEKDEETNISISQAQKRQLEISQRFYDVEEFF